MGLAPIDQGACTPCPANSFTTIEGSTSQAACICEEEHCMLGHPFRAGRDRVPGGGGGGGRGGKGGGGRGGKGGKGKRR